MPQNTYSLPDRTTLRTGPVPLRWLVLPAILSVLALALGEAIDLDHAVTRLLFDAQIGAFPLRHEFWLEVVMHHWTKYAVTMLGCLVAAGVVLSFLLPALRPHRRMLLFLVLALSLAPMSVTLAKSVSSRNCPWDVEEFGGTVPYTRLFERNAPDLGRGHCFPAGHASTGFALMAFYFVAYAQRRRRAAHIALWIGLMAGVLLGMGRVLQGAHFVSHVLWSGVLCWMVMVLLYRAVLHLTPAVESGVPAASVLGS